MIATAVLHGDHRDRPSLFRTTGWLYCNSFWTTTMSEHQISKLLCIFSKHRLTRSRQQVALIFCVPPVWRAHLTPACWLLPRGRKRRRQLFRCFLSPTSIHDALRSTHRQGDLPSLWKKTYVYGYFPKVPSSPPRLVACGCTCTHLGCAWEQPSTMKSSQRTNYDYTGDT